MAFEHRPNSGTAFKNNYKTADNQPGMKGEGLGQCPHCKGTWAIDLALWRKNDKNGNAYVSLSLAPREAQGDPPQTAGSQMPDDEIPF